MSYMSLKNKKVVGLQRQQAEMKKTLIGSENLTIGIKTMSSPRNIMSLRNKKVFDTRVNQCDRKISKPKVIAKSLY